MKVVMIDAQFPELKGGACNQRGKGTGMSVKAAAARAFADLLRPIGYLIRKAVEEFVTKGNYIHKSLTLSE